MAGEERLKWETMSKDEREKQLYAFTNPVPEKTITQEMRQKAFDNYQTTDDHGMLMTGIAKARMEQNIII
jgi:bleomycin hydrolase